MKKDSIGIFPKLSTLQPLPDRVLCEVNNPALVTKPYRARSVEEISLCEVGETIMVTKHLEYSWSEGYSFQNRRTGIFPTDCVKIIEDKPVAPDSPIQPKTIKNLNNQINNLSLENYGNALRVNIVGDSVDSPYLTSKQPEPTRRDFKNTPGLPNGWELNYLKDGTPFYIDHNNQKTSWAPPMYSPHSQRSGVVPIRHDQLRPNWQQLVDSNGNLFFVDHNTRTTHWRYPF